MRFFKLIVVATLGYLAYRVVKLHNATPGKITWRAAFASQVPILGRLVGPGNSQPAPPSSPAQ